MQVEVLEPHGFCAGVTAALRKALSLSTHQPSAPHPPKPSNPQTLKPSLFCLHELVHNEIVVEDLKKRGFAFVESLDEVPEGATVLFSAHGVSPEVRERARVRRLEVVDATCPFVERVHRAARGFVERGVPVVVVGNPGHAEVKGILGEAPYASVVSSVSDAKSLPPPNHEPRITNHEPRITNHEPRTIGVVSQTTMNADEVRAIVAALRERFVVETAADVCNATKERQDAVKSFGGDALLVLGSANSSNTRRLCEIARCRTFRAGTMDEVEALDLSGVEVLGVTSGASTPESFLDQAVRFLRRG